MCLSSRAIHLEVVNNLSTDSFLNAYCSFVRPIRHLRSSQGTSFVGGRNDLEKALSMMDHQNLQQELVKTNCDSMDFKINIPEANHKGGAWEHQIPLVLKVLVMLLPQHAAQFDEEALRTSKREAKAIVNYHPLTVDTLNSPTNARGPYAQTPSYHEVEADTSPSW